MLDAVTNTQEDALMAEMIAAGLISPPGADEILVRDEAEEVAVPEKAMLDDAALADLEAELRGEEERAEIYAEAAAGADFVPTGGVIEARAESEDDRLGGSSHGAYVASLLGDAEVERVVNALPKKVKDKATNLVDHIKGGRALSVYTQTAIAMLREHGRLTTPGLVHAYCAQAKRNGGEGYSIGTARSQAGQQSSLLKGFGIIDAAGAVNGASPLARALGLA